MELEGLVPKAFLIIAGISILCCLARPDFNLPLFVFAWLIWSEADKSQRIRVFYLMIITFIVDFIWLCYWGSVWNNEIDSGNWESGVHHFVFALCVINFIIKLAAIVLAGLTEKENFKENLPSVFSRVLG
ncbi:unnamed protein product [Blepharisma stoltei]|uniref:Uncharacterized protein n=1 Tax=Blepharisma stoltei TaxID=1481888 RepID=A0AAU9J897_9CILI|nr:unnamed protein product [Blepharisma stoltei]